MELITGPWTGSHAYESENSSLPPLSVSAIGGLTRLVSDDISDVLDADAAKMCSARLALSNAEAVCTSAILSERQGRNGKAITTWRSLFGNLFPAS